MDQTSSIQYQLGQNLRILRKERGLTQQDFAQLSEIPRSTISLLESGSANPTLSLLNQLALALQISLEELISTPHAQSQLFPKGSLPIEKRGKNGSVRIQKLLPDKIPGMEIDRIELEPGAHMKGIPHRPGTREYLCCEKGRITLWAWGERFELKPGDVVAFQGDQPHSYHNDFYQTAIGFSVVTLSPLHQKT